MKKSKRSVEKQSPPREKVVPDLQSSAQPGPSSQKSGLWKEGVSVPHQKSPPTQQAKTTATKAVDVRLVEDQGQLSMKAKVDSIHSSVSAQDLSKTIPARRHLMVPINVQALVVPPTSNGKQPHLNNEKSPQAVNKPQTISSSSFGQRASLKTEIRTLTPTDSSSVEQEEPKSGWGLPEPFDYQSANPDSTGLSEGIHIFWTLPKALLQGELKDQEATVENEYKSPEDFVPERYIPADEGFEHPISFEQAVEHRVEFTTEDSPDGALSETLEFGQLPDRWIVVRLGSNPSLKAWVIESTTLEVTPLAGYSPTTNDSTDAKMTAIGPNDGDIYWTATYDNAKNRFTFHDVPNPGEVGPFDYVVCGWFSNREKDPAFMDKDASEEEWFAFIRDNLGWNVSRSDVDDDFNIFLNPITMPMEVQK